MSQLFSPYVLGPLTLRNRIVIAPMCQYSAHHGEASDWHLLHLGQLALSGAGLLILEATAVTSEASHLAGRPGPVVGRHRGRAGPRASHGAPVFAHAHRHPALARGTPGLQPRAVGWRAADRARGRGLDATGPVGPGPRVSPLQQIPVRPGYQVPLANTLRHETGLPTIAVGMITEPQQAEAILAGGQADLVALARGILFDPHWPWHAAAALGAQVEAPPQYWRSQPRELPGLFGDIRIGQR